MKIDVCFTPALYPYYKGDENSIVVVTDIFRATTTMCTALQNGAASVIPVKTLDEAKKFKDKGYLVGGERNVIRFDFADFGNSPFEYTPEKVKGQDIVLSTTNGTQAIEAASEAAYLLIGAFVNINTVADYCLLAKKNILILCSGWQNRFSVEDSLFAGALSELLIESNSFELTSDDARVALHMWKEAKKDIYAYIANTDHFNRLKAHDLLLDANYCLNRNTIPLLPMYDNKTGKIVI